MILNTRNFNILNYKINYFHVRSKCRKVLKKFNLHRNVPLSNCMTRIESRHVSLSILAPRARALYVSRATRARKILLSFFVWHKINIKTISRYINGEHSLADANLISRVVCMFVRVLCFVCIYIFVFIFIYIYICIYI